MILALITSMSKRLMTITEPLFKQLEKYFHMEFTFAIDETKKGLKKE